MVRDQLGRFEFTVAQLWKLVDLTTQLDDLSGKSIDGLIDARRLGGKRTSARKSDGDE